MVLQSKITFNHQISITGSSFRSLSKIINCCFLF